MAKKSITVKTLDKVAKELNSSWEISYHKKEGWYLHKPDGDIFLGSDGKGAFQKLITHDKQLQ